MKKLTLLIALLLIYSSAAFAQIGFNNDGSQPDPSAGLDVKFTDKGFLMPRLTTEQIQAIPAPANGLQVYCTTDSKIYIFVGPENRWKELAYGTGTISLPVSCGSSITINHLASEGVAPVDKNVTYNIVTGIPGEPSKCWITSNLGADHQATAVNDATEESAGWYWQFNRLQGYKHDGTSLTPSVGWINHIVENSNWTLENDPCNHEFENGWHIPTYSEWDNVESYGGWVNEIDPFYSPLKLHEAGEVSNGNMIQRGVRGFYWTKNQSSEPKSGLFIAYIFSFAGDGVPPAIEYKSNGLSVRCILDPDNVNPVTPQVGDTFEGGIVFYVDGSGNGLIAAPADQGTGVEWGCNGTLIGATASGIGAGPVNTVAIVNGCSEAGIAARICNDLVLDGYDDWYLPSEEELTELYFQKDVVGGFTAGNYWNSTENDLNNSEAVSFSDGTLISELKDNSLNVRAIRSFCTCDPSFSLSDKLQHEENAYHIVWKWFPGEGATGYRWNTVDDYTTSEDMGLSLYKTQTGLSCYTDYYSYVWAYNDCGHSAPAQLRATTAPCCYEESLTIIHYAGNVAPVTKTVLYDIVYNIPGEETKCWITSNLGASQQALAVNDASEESAGWYWKFNTMQGYKHDNTNPTPAWTFSLIDENSDWIATNDPCKLELGSTWRIPSSTEWNNIMTTGGWTDWTGPYSWTRLRLHAAGYIINLSGALDGRGVYGQYWSSTQLDNQNAWYLNFNSTSCTVGNTAKSHGIPVRCIKN